MANRLTTTLKGIAHRMAYTFIATILMSVLSFDAHANTKREFLRCLSEVERKTGIDRNILLAIKLVESGKELRSMVRTNKNATSDIGIMQINSVWLPQLRSYGISQDSLLNHCVNLKVATWILYRHLKKTGDIWQAVGLYHSHTPHLNKRYRKRVRTAYQKILAVRTKEDQ